MLAVYSLAGLAAGLLVGFLLPVTLPVQWSAYAATALLAVLSSLIGAARADGEEHFVLGRFAWGLGINIVLGLLLTALGDRLAGDGEGGHHGRTPSVSRTALR